jgi:hypothetical protein
MSRNLKESSESRPDVEKVFADERTRIGWEIVQAVERIAKTLPPEGQHLNSQPIIFEEEYRHRGLNAVFAAGTVIGTGRRNVLLVPERTLGILTELKIPYTIFVEDST